MLHHFAWRSSASGDLLDCFPTVSFLPSWLAKRPCRIGHKCERADARLLCGRHDLGNRLIARVAIGPQMYGRLGLGRCSFAEFQCQRVLVGARDGSVRGDRDAR